MRESLVESNFVESKDPNQHEHHCPDCKQTWSCTDHWPVWDQEDSDCRWHTEVVCKDCMKKRLVNVDFSEAEIKMLQANGVDINDAHTQAAIRLYGKYIITPEMRRDVKAANYAAAYDATPDTIRNLMGFTVTGRIPRKDIP